MPSQQQFLLTAVSYLLVSAVPVRADWGPGSGGYGGSGWDGDDDGSGWGRCWWTGDCGDDSGDDGSGSGSGNGSNLDPSQLGYSAAQISNYNRIMIVHAVLASMVWVLLIPLGGILVRLGIKSPWIVRIHAFLQSMAYLVYVAAAALGIYLVRQLSYGGYSMWSDPHTKLGVAVLVLAFFQPFLEIIHHSLFKKRAAAAKDGSANKKAGRSAPGGIHLWLGRALIVLGMINGGLGLRLAANSPFETNTRPKTIGYSVAAAVMFLLYVLFVVRGERRRSKERKEQSSNERGLPLEDARTSTSTLPGYHHPPSYDESQESFRKEGQTTARYT